MVDKTLIMRKLSDLDDLYRQLQEYSGISIKEYETDWRTQRIVERTLHVMIEVCLDVAGHIISDGHYRVPTSYADTFRVLYENKLIEEDLLDSLEKMAKFRNLLVHAYEKIDANPIVNILANDLKDFESFKFIWNSQQGKEIKVNSSRFRLLILGILAHFRHFRHSHLVFIL